MARNNQARFLSHRFFLIFAGKSLPVQGLVSESGISNLDCGKGLLEELTGSRVQVQITPELLLGGAVSRHRTESGTFFRIDFSPLADAERGLLAGLLEAGGSSPSWQRQFPRIPVGESEKKNLPVVNLCMISVSAQESAIASIVNFSVGGVRIEFEGAKAAPIDLKLGGQLAFELLTSAGDILGTFQGEIRNFDSSGGRTAVGIRFLEMKPSLRQSFFSLIKDYCHRLTETQLASCA